MAKIKSWTANPSNIYILAISLGFLLVMGASFLTIDAGVDDAFIVYRYVDRFLEFKGLTYNDGEHVEGFTSLLWTLLLAAGSFISGIRPHIVSIWINYLSLELTK